MGLEQRVLELEILVASQAELIASLRAENAELKARLGQGLWELFDATVS